MRPADPTPQVYTPASEVTSESNAFTDPLVITFSTPISGFSVDIDNNNADTYAVTDNFGNSQMFTDPANTTHTFTLADTGITSVEIFAFDQFWDFAIDNVMFTADTASTPEPSTLPMLGAALAGLVWLRRRARA